MAFVDSSDALKLQDRVEILELFARYAWSFDIGDIEGFLQTFAPDAVYELPGGRRYVGREQIRTYIEPAVASDWAPGRQHHVDQVIMQGSSTRCEARSYCMGTLRSPADGSLSVVFTGYYTDTLVKLDGTWLIERRVFRHWDRDEARALIAPERAGVR